MKKLFFCCSPPAPRLVAKVIAARGGDVEGDILLAQKSRVPIFTLAAALRQPDVYRGRWGAGPGGDVGDERGRHERSCIFEGNFVAGDLARDTSGRRAEDQPLVHHLGERAGADERIRRRAGGAQINTRDQTERSTVRQKFENEKVETGRPAVGKLQRADPFLEPEKDFLFMARFDGVRPGDDEQPVAMLSIAAYFQPNALLIQ